MLSRRRDRVFPKQCIHVTCNISRRCIKLHHLVLKRYISKKLPTSCRCLSLSVIALKIPLAITCKISVHSLLIRDNTTSPQWHSLNTGNKTNTVYWWVAPNSSNSQNQISNENIHWCRGLSICNIYIYIYHEVPKRTSHRSCGLDNPPSKSILSHYEIRVLTVFCTELK